LRHDESAQRGGQDETVEVPAEELLEGRVVAAVVHESRLLGCI
jgi:hypothetical protein